MTALKPQELRIGNLIRGIYINEEQEEDVEHSQIVAVTSLDSIGAFDYSIWVECIEGSANVEVYDRFEGIPLTEERLVELGFEKAYNDNMTVSWFSLKIGSNEYILNYLNRWGISIDTGDTYRYLTPCEHLHTLQNVIFALTGTELTTKSN